MYEGCLWGASMLTADISLLTYPAPLPPHRNAGNPQAAGDGRRAGEAGAVSGAARWRRTRGEAQRRGRSGRHGRAAGGSARLQRGLLQGNSLQCFPGQTRYTISTRSRHRT